MVFPKKASESSPFPPFPFFLLTLIEFERATANCQSSLGN